jgi:hypothetical protein
MSEASSAAASVRELLDANPMVGEGRRGVRRFWTMAELIRLRENYPKGGVEACLPVLPGRSAGSIYQRAAIESLIPARKKGAVPRQRWFSSPQIDAVITRAFQRAPSSRGEINRFAKTLGRPRWWVSKRAGLLGLVSPRFKQPPWTEEEDDIISEKAALRPAMIVRALARRGFKRSETAVVVRLKRIGSSTGRNADTEHYSATALSKLFGLDGHVVTRWITEGRLIAKRRGTERTERQGGDEWKVHRRSVRQFVIENPAAIDLRKVDKFWFIEMLAGRT